MPHLTLEYSDNIPGLDLRQALIELNETLLGSGQFDEADVKSRALRLDTFQVGIRPLPRAFIHVRLALLDGRSPEIKRSLAASLLAVLQRQSRDWQPAGEVQISVETQDMDRATYAKLSVGQPQD